MKIKGIKNLLSKKNDDAIPVGPPLEPASGINTTTAPVGEAPTQAPNPVPAPAPVPQPAPVEPAPAEPNTGVSQVAQAAPGGNEEVNQEPEVTLQQVLEDHELRLRKIEYHLRLA